MNFVRIRSLIGLPPSAPALSALASYAAYRRLRITITAPADQQPPRAVATPRRASSLAAAVADRPASGTSVGRRRSAKARARSPAAVRLAFTQLGLAGTAERDQVPLVIAAGFAAGDDAMVLQIIGRTTGGAEGELHCFALSIRSRIRCTDFGPWPVPAPIARYAAPARRMAFIRSMTAISVTFGTKRLMSPSRTMS